MLMDDADVAAWQNEGLPADRMSTENATILTSCQRWPFMVDPQLQGLKWIKNRHGDHLRVVRIGQRGYLDTIERALAAGDVVLIQNMEEAVDPVLGPLLGRETIKKGRCIRIGDKECEYNPNFRLILQTKLANPHYQPELQAQCTLINFTVTRDGLEDQLLASVQNGEEVPFRAPSWPLQVPFRSPSWPLQVPFMAPSGPLQVPFMAPSGPLQVPFMAPSGPLQVSFMTPSWPLQVPFRSPSLPLQVPFMAPSSPLQVPFIAPSRPLQVPFRSPSLPLQVPFMAPSSPLQVPIIAPSGPLQVPFMSPSGPLHCPFKTPSGPLQVSEGDLKYQSNLTKQQNLFKITLKTLEDTLLSRLSSAAGDFLGDTELVENLETTKLTAADIEEKVKEARVTEAQINEAREHYRKAASRASLIYFIMNDLHKIHPMYQFSLKAFSVVFQKAVQKACPDDSLPQRVSNLMESITSSSFQYTTRGLFECDKLTFTAQLLFQILLVNQEMEAEELDFLLRNPVVGGVSSPLPFLSHHAWGGVKSLCSMEAFRNLDRDMEGSAKRWQKFAECECPEREKLPQDWKNKTSLQKLCVMRALRPDRMTYAVRDFVSEKLGSQYVAGRSLDFSSSFEESGPATPMFFILSPGVDPLKDGQEVVAEQALDQAAKEGHWNIHLVSKWLGTLEKLLEETAVSGHAHFRVFVSAEPASSPGGHLIPQGLLESAVKASIVIYPHSSSSSPSTPSSSSPSSSPSSSSSSSPSSSTPSSSSPSSSSSSSSPSTPSSSSPSSSPSSSSSSSPSSSTPSSSSPSTPSPSSPDVLEWSPREAEFRSILFSLCFFHAVVAERRKFGPQGWNRSYPFNTGDLTISVSVLYNYLDANAKVPYDDLRYLFGEIMYGGHITDDWDRRLCRTYLEEYVKPEMVEGEHLLAPGFPLPPTTDYSGYHQYVDEVLPPESPYLYGLHPNAEMGFLSQTSEKLFRTVLEMQPQDGASADGGGATREEKNMGNAFYHFYLFKWRRSTRYLQAGEVSSMYLQAGEVSSMYLQAGEVSSMYLQAGGKVSSMYLQAGEVSSMYLQAGEVSSMYLQAMERSPPCTFRLERSPPCTFRLERSPPCTFRLERSPPCTFRLERSPPCTFRLERSPPCTFRLERSPPCTFRLERSPPCTFRLERSPPCTFRLGEVSSMYLQAGEVSSMYLQAGEVSSMYLQAGGKVSSMNSELRLS
ncbi:hypothetical protein NHX12_025278 [Muraenolepis orangiensis]|uniref:Dynein heavy chain n=1 Tax=Muraenolepis orangiensis TaxID=630683 RepID=A0A9Q0EKW7_9TELE|nr:hypothetical protein NHX12_025278 [Muraenolepis orangiensis]